MSEPTAVSPLVHGREIPTRRVTINSPSQLPADYCTSPGGATLFSTTPGGTRLIYDRGFLMQCRNSPLAKSPPANMTKIPGVTSPGKVEPVNGHDEEDKEVKTAKKTEGGKDDEQFEMDI